MSQGCRVRRDRLIVLSFVSVGMGKSEPSRTQPRVDQDGFSENQESAELTPNQPNSPKEPPRLFPPLAGKVPQAYGVPSNRVIRIIVHELMSQQEQL